MSAERKALLQEAHPEKLHGILAPRSGGDSSGFAKNAIARNAAGSTVLRHADWRHLLPAPPLGGHTHLLLRGGPAELPQYLEETGFARRVSTTLQVHETADVIVVLDSAVSPQALPELLRRLRPGGVVYVEIDRLAIRSRPGPHHVRRLLRGAGLAEVRTYWIRPNLRRRQAYVPLDSGRELRWFLRSYYVSENWRERALRAAALVGSLLRWTRRNPVFRSYGLTAVAARYRSCPIGPLAAPESPVELRQAEGSVVLIANGRDDLNRLVLLRFPKGQDVPSAVVKWSRLPLPNDAVSREHLVLKHLRKVLPNPLAQSIPEPRATFLWNDAPVAAESYVPGRSLAAIASGTWVGSGHDSLHSALTWLRQFHKVTRTATTWSTADHEAFITARVRTCLAACDWPAPETEFLHTLESRARELIGRVVPRVIQHNDFNPWNISRHGRELYVFDWEAGESGPPLLDLVYFAVEWYALSVGRSRSPDAMREALQSLFCSPMPEGSAAACVDSEISEYVRSVGVDPRFVPIAVGLYAIQHALRRHDRQGLLTSPAEGQQGEARRTLVSTLAASESALWEWTARRGTHDRPRGGSSQ